MDIRVTKTHKVTFSVECIEETEGGANYYSFGDSVDTIEQAITTLEIANNHEKRDWFIRAEVETNVTGKSEDCRLNTVQSEAPVASD